MEFLSLSPFVPSGPDFDKAKQLFQEVGFTLTWEAEGYAGFGQANCTFILQHYDAPSFAQNFMLSVGVAKVAPLREAWLQKGLPEKYGITLGPMTQQPYGLEVNLIDMAGVCWHFVENGQ